MFIAVFKTWEFRDPWRVLEKDNTGNLSDFGYDSEPKPLGNEVIY
jgi:hypothetical protein